MGRRDVRVRAGLRCGATMMEEPLTPRSGASAAAQTRRNRIGLCLLNFFSADIRDGLGPFAAVYLLQEAKWRPHRIGIAMTANSISQFVVQTPVGAFIDWTEKKKAVCAACCVLVAAMSLSMIAFPEFISVVGTRIIQGVGSATLPPAIAAMTLVSRSSVSLCMCRGPGCLARRVPSSEMFLRCRVSWGRAKPSQSRCGTSKHGLSLQTMTLITSDCGATPSPSIKWP